MKSLIKAQGLVKAYGNGAERRRVLDGLSVSIVPGSFVAIMGPSGCGKTTLLFALSGMDRIDEGAVEFEGLSIASFNEKALSDLRRTRMGFVFQQPAMLKNLNIIDNVILASLRDKRGKAAELAARAQSLMDGAGIGELAYRDTSQVSGGQLQRAGICRALMNQPSVIFGDEPTGALNSVAAEGIMDMLAHVNSGGTAVVLVTHDARVAARAERVLFMRDGAIVAEECLGKFSAAHRAARVETVSAHMLELGI